MTARRTLGWIVVSVAALGLAGGLAQRFGALAPFTAEIAQPLPETIVSSPELSLPPAGPASSRATPYPPDTAAQAPVPGTAPAPPAAGPVLAPPQREARLPPSPGRFGPETMTSGVAIPAVEPEIPALGPVGPLRNALDTLSSGDIRTARVLRDTLAPGSLDRDILVWAIAQGQQASVAEIEAAAANLAGWPGVEALGAARERALYRDKPTPEEAIRALGANPPRTRQGTLLLARSHLALGNVDAAQKVLGAYWRTEKLDAAVEASFLAEFSSWLGPADHRARLERMLYADRARSAERLAKLAGAVELAAAWSAVLRSDRAAQKRLDAVPAAQRSAGFFFAQARLLRRQEKFILAAQAMARAPTDASAEIDPEAWWTERRVLSRELHELGKPDLAYEVAAGQRGGSPSTRVDAGFHAGWFALRSLGDPAKALPHFAAILEAAEGPISFARGHYWLGRANEAADPSKAREHFEKAATFDTAFYGQLAAQRLGRKTMALRQSEPSVLDRRAFAGRAAVRAIERLEEAGAPRLADALVRGLAQELESPGEVALLAAIEEDQGNHYGALRIVKAASARGVPVGALSHPVGAIPAEAAIPGAGKALAYAVARQESEFNVAAVSPAGALGLLQLMPSTARQVARRANLPYSPARLTTDAGYNATLGAAFLAEQLARFDGSYVLTFAGYNAGPGRALDWIKRFGDPRGKPVDEVVDWIEQIPFTETRGYVQRVLENYEVYKMRLTGEFDIVGDLVNGRRTP